MSHSRFMFKQLLTIAACVGALAGAGLARAQAANPKIASDLAAVIGAPTLPPVNWAASINGPAYAKVLIVANDSDPTLASLRQAILAQGGSVQYVYLSVRALAGVVPVAGLNALAARSDVMTIAPNRATARTATKTTTTTLAATATNTPSTPTTAATTANTTGTTAYNGANVAIAVLDSGIDWDHRNLRTPAGKYRVAGVVDFVANSKKLLNGGWELGVDVSLEVDKLVRVDKGLSTAKELARLAPISALPDYYGHGTHVASIAAGAGDYQLPDSSGVASNATLFDVRVLDENGQGNLADVLAGIDWVMQRSRLFNIRVMNLSLAANATD